MSETVKLIIEIPKAKYEDLKNFVPSETDEEEYIKNGVPLDDVKAEIENRSYGIANGSVIQMYERRAVLEILDNIGKENSK